MKTRVSELAKRLGVKPADLVKKLREIGFENVRSPASTLDDSELMQAEMRLEAYGVVPEKSLEAASAAETMKGGRRAKPAAPTATATAVEEPPAPSIEEAARPKEETGEARVETAPEAPPAVEAPSPEPKPAPSPGAAPEVEARPAPEGEPPAPPLPPPTPSEVEAPAEVGKIAPEPVAIPSAAPEAPPLEAAPDEEPAPAEPLPAAAAAAPSAPEGMDQGLAVGEREEAVPPARKEAAATRAPKRPPAATPRRGAKILGKIDLGPLARRPAAEKPASTAPTAEPRPTYDHDRRRALMRGDYGLRDRLTSTQLKDREEARRQRQREARRPARGGYRGRPAPPATARPAPTIDRTGKILLDPPITVKTLSLALGVKAPDLLKVLFGLLGFGKVNINSTLEEETAALAASEFGYEIEAKKIVGVEEEVLDEIEQARTQAEGPQQPRPPVIALLGHVDHGKTSLLDAIRKSNLTAGEAGGITQRIGAYQVTTPSGHRVTVIDTPGHRAFTAMRARGARATDLVVLVVGADDGVMPQTEEAVNHARAAGVPIVVALNKIDKPEANPMRAKNQLSSLGLIPEDWGGKTAVVETAATAGRGVVELLERVALEAEVLELRASPANPASGVVLEATVSEGRGIVAHLLVRDGTLRRGDLLLAGGGHGRIRALYDDAGNELEEAPPSTPVEALGFLDLPEAGDRFFVVDDLARAREVAAARGRKARALARVERRQVTLETLSEALAAGATKEIRIVLKADGLGTLEVLRKALPELSAKEVTVSLLHAAVGAITESDVLLAETSQAIVVGFSVVPDDKARQAAEARGVDVRLYRVIYELLDDVRKAMEGLLAPVEREVVVGHAEIRALFKSSKFGNIAGCIVKDGSIARANPVRLLRDGRVVWSGKLGSLRRVKDDVREVKEGFECGIKIEGYEDIQVGDVIESFEVVEERRALSPATADAPAPKAAAGKGSRPGGS